MKIDKLLEKIDKDKESVKKYRRYLINKMNLLDLTDFTYQKLLKINKVIEGEI